ncbi:MAG: HEAT repeat domain-containing protein [Planctomycetaceae bacterium]|nr:HEAT repeat domain-containing protein [Planctomycetaceae bacterium]
MKLDSIVAFACLSLSWLAADASADILVLRNGGRLEGEILKRTELRGEREATAYIVRLKTGVRLKIDGREVRKVVADSPAHSQYKKLLADMPNTAVGHWSMAEWCQQQNLRQQRTYHQQQVLQLDPNHEKARRSLGYTRFNGKWGKRDDRMRAQGYELFEGKYMLPQQIAIKKRNRNNDLAQKKWRRDLKTLRSQLNGARQAQAKEQFKTIKDPRAVMALQEMLKSEELAEVREIYVDALGHIKGPAAISALITSSLDDPDLEVRLRAVDHLRRIGPEPAVRTFSKSLQSKSNRTINRAGVALGRLGNTDAVLPLIDSLITRHERIVKPANAITPSFSRNSDGSGGMNGLSVGGGPKKVVRNLKNQSVLEALISLTDQNYQYSKLDWKEWYIRQQEAGEVNLRRDS